MSRYTFLRSGSSAGDIYAWAKKLITDLNSSSASGGIGAAPTGGLMAWLSDTPPDGWLICDGTSYLIDDQRNLFVKIGQTYGGSGNEFKVPDFRNRLLMGAGTLVGLNATAGADNVAMTADQMPKHTHTVDDPAHTHVFTADEHTHVVIDPTHTHGVTDPGHSHAGGADALAIPASAGTGGATYAATTSASVTGVTIANAATGVTNTPTTITGENASAETGITNEETGGDQPFSVLNPVFGVNMIIKA